MKKFILTSAIIIIAVSNLFAQRKVTPVEDKKTTITTVEEKKAAKELLDKKVKPHLIFSDSVITVPDELKDDTVKVSKHKQPLLYEATAGLDIWDPLMRIFGQKYGLFSVSAELNLYNRFLPAIELGIGNANDTPDDGNFTYKTPVSFFFKVGGSYNFLYKGNPDYKLLGGFRLGYSSFSYDITDISTNSGYWGDNGNFDITDQKSHALWGEFSLGLRVKIYKQISMGWSFKYKVMFSCKKNPNSNPWYIPGYGAENHDFGASYSIFYNFSLSKKAPNTAEKITQELDKLPEKSDSTVVKGATDKTNTIVKVPAGDSAIKEEVTVKDEQTTKDNISTLKENAIVTDPKTKDKDAEQKEATVKDKSAEPAVKATKVKSRNNKNGK